MQVIFFMMCMVCLVVYTAIGYPAPKDRTVEQGEILAAHMTAWHKGAVRRCVATTCGPVVDPTPYLFPSMSSAPAFAVNRFTTRYDATTKVMVTSVNTGVTDRTGVSYELLMSALNEGVGGESSSIGVFDKPSSKVKLTALTGVFDKTTVNVPPAIAAAMQDGTPVIVSNM